MGPASVSMGGSAVGARSAEGLASVSMGGSAISARSVEGQAFVSMGGYAVNTRSAEGQAFVNKEGSYTFGFPKVLNQMIHLLLQLQVDCTFPWLEESLQLCEIFDHLE